MGGEKTGGEWKSEEIKSPEKANPLGCAGAGSAANASGAEEIPCPAGGTTKGACIADMLLQHSWP